MTNNLTMQELLEQQEQEFNQVKVGQTISGKISKITNDEVVVELNYGFDGVINNEELYTSVLLFCNLKLLFSWSLVFVRLTKLSLQRVFSEHSGFSLMTYQKIS